MIGQLLISPPKVFIASFKKMEIEFQYKSWHAKAANRKILAVF